MFAADDAAMLTPPLSLLMPLPLPCCAYAHYADVFQQRRYARREAAFSPLPIHAAMLVMPP